LLITILQRFFANAIAFSMVGVPPECKRRSLCPRFPPYSSSRWQMCR